MRLLLVYKQDIDIPHNTSTTTVYTIDCYKTASLYNVEYTKRTTGNNSLVTLLLIMIAEIVEFFIIKKDRLGDSQAPHFNQRLYHHI